MNPEREYMRQLSVSRAQHYARGHGPAFTEQGKTFKNSDKVVLTRDIQTELSGVLHQGKEGYVLNSGDEGVLVRFKESGDVNIPKDWSSEVLVVSEGLSPQEARRSIFEQPVEPIAPGTKVQVIGIDPAISMWKSHAYPGAVWDALVGQEGQILWSVYSTPMFTMYLVQLTNGQYEFTSSEIAPLSGTKYMAGSKGDKSNLSEGDETTKSQHPEGITDDHLDYLDNLRDSGVTNMFGARPYVADEFGVDKNEAGKILSYWMKTFGKLGRKTQESLSESYGDAGYGLCDWCGSPDGPSVKLTYTRNEVDQKISKVCDVCRSKPIDMPQDYKSESKKCSDCGSETKHTQIADREWVCEACGGLVIR